MLNKKQESESSPSVNDLVKAGLEQLKAGNTLKFNVNIKNPQAIIDKAEALKGSREGCGGAGSSCNGIVPAPCCPGLSCKFGVCTH